MPDALSPIGSSGPFSTLLGGSSAPAPATQPTTQSQNPVQGPGEAEVAAEKAKQKSIRAEADKREEARRVQPQLTVDQAAEAFREFLKNLPSDLQFRSDNESGYIVFKVINPVTREVIRQYPPDEILEMAKRIKETLKGGEGHGVLLDRQL